MKLTIKDKSTMTSRKWRNSHLVLCVTGLICLAVSPAERKEFWLLYLVALAIIGLLYSAAKKDSERRAHEQQRVRQWFSRLKGHWMDYLYSPKGNLSDYERIRNFVRIHGTAQFIYGDASQIEGSVTCIVGDVSGLSGGVDRLSGYVGNIHGDVSDLRGHVSGLQGDVTKLSGYISGPLKTIHLGGRRVEYWSDPAVGWTTGLEGDLTGIHGNLTHVYGTLQEGLTGDISLIWGDISGLTGRIESTWYGSERGKVGKPLVYGDATGLEMDLTRFQGDLSLLPRNNQLGSNYIS